MSPQTKRMSSKRRLSPSPTCDAADDRTFGPPTPERLEASCCGTPDLGISQQLWNNEDAIMTVLKQWRCLLVVLQPKVVISDAILRGALAVLQSFAARRPDASAAMDASPPHLASFAAASLWLSAKLCGVRTQIPNRKLMCQATGVHPEALSSSELDVCAGLNWDVGAVLRAHGLLH